METGFTSPRHDLFPAGLRVLVVDDDPTWLKILEKMLRKCSYEVTTCGLARDALNLLRERKDGYDIVISDVNMPDMDGFKLLEHVGLEMELPVIMMSVDGETSRVMKGVQHGACDYLLKPIRMKELRNIWQHVLRKRIHERRDTDSHEVIDGLQMTRSWSDRCEDHYFSGEDISTGKKRKEAEAKYDDKGFTDPGSTTKKARVVWSVDLHQKFVKAVNQIGFQKVGPKRILDLMNVPWLTRENVASHLQKYRLYLSRLQKENDFKTCLGGIIKHSDTTSPDPPVSFSTQTTKTASQEDISNRNFRFSGNNLLAQNKNPEGHEIDMKGISPVPREEPKRMLTAEVPNKQENRGMKIGLKQSFVPSGPEEGHTVFDCSVPSRCSSRVPEVTFKEQGDPHIHLENSAHSPKSVNSRPHLAEGEGTKFIEYKPLYANNRHSTNVQVSPMKAQSDTVDAQDMDNILHRQGFQPIPPCPPNTQGQSFDLSCLPSTQPAHRCLSMVNESLSGPSYEDLQVGWLQDDPFSTNLGLQNSELLGYSDPCTVAEVPIHLYNALRSDYEQFVDPNECSIFDHGLFIA